MFRHDMPSHHPQEKSKSDADELHVDVRLCAYRCKEKWCDF